MNETHVAYSVIDLSHHLRLIAEIYKRNKELFTECDPGKVLGCARECYQSCSETKTCPEVGFLT